MSEQATRDAVKIVTFYRFVAVPDHKALAASLEARARAAGLLGTLILAAEGVNATLAGEPVSVDAFIGELAQDKRFARLKLRESYAAEMPFFRLKVRLRAEIVTLGQPDVHPEQRTGKHVTAQEWHALLEDPEVVVLDTRNEYEVGAGSFAGALDPGTRSFREFPDFVARNLDPGRNRKVAMFCTGGIRCEKASAWMLQQGFEQVYQLDGGILSYLEQVPADEGRWHGECFVFDQRVAVGYGLVTGRLGICFGCRMPLTEMDLESPLYEEGVSCPQCHDALDDVRRAGLRERHRQELLARARGEAHLGKPQRTSS